MPKTCLECGGHDVEWMGRVAQHLWEQLETLRRPSKPMTGSNVWDDTRL